MNDRSLHDDLEALELAAPFTLPPALRVSRRRPFMLWLPAGLALVAGMLIGLFGAQLLPREQLATNVAVAPVSSGALAAGCPVTRRPNPLFVPPTGPAAPPAYYHGFWYGSDALWTMPESSGTWPLAPNPDGWLTQKTFWWSKDFAEPRPDITVTGRRLDGRAEAIRTDQPTNASADFGTAMLVGIELPTPGCWELTAEYRGHSLSYVVWVEKHEPVRQTATLDWQTTKASVDALHLAEVGGRLIATGTGDGPEAAWYSDNGGESWKSARISAGPDQASWHLGAVAERDGQLISLGWAPNSPIGADADRRAVIWTSDDDGAIWRPLAGGTAPSVSGNVVAGGPGYVMVGNPVDAASGRYTNHPEIWTSTDGANWTQVETEAFANSYMSGLASRGRIVAVGVVGDDPADARTPTAWWSDDGLTWHSIALSGAASVSAVTTDASGFVAAGTAVDGSLAVWDSVDGETWNLVPNGLGGWGSVASLAAGPLGIVVSGASKAGSPVGTDLVDPFGHPLLAFLPADGASPSTAEDLQDWPMSVAALRDRFVTLADKCPPNADCYVQLRSVLVGTAHVGSALSPTSEAVALPTLTTDNGTCPSVGLNVTLFGDAADPRVTWLVRDDGSRQDIIWPPGFTARFSPKLEVLDASGSVVFRGGDRIDGGCTAGPPDDPAKLLIIRPDS